MTRSKFYAIITLYKVKVKVEIEKYRREKMVLIEKFLGKRVEIPENRRYIPKQGLWSKLDGDSIIFGLSEAALILSGGLNDLEQLVENGYAVKEGDAIAFAITGKIQYFDAPISGQFYFNSAVKESPSLVLKDCYTNGWIFRIKPEEDAEKAMVKMVDTSAYIESLKYTEGFKNPDGLKGGVSGICKAVYTGIQEQKI
jgi:glycine cleavage system H lipoate-binding protein